MLYQTLLYMPAQLLAPMFQFIAAVVWTHWLLPDAYGVLTYVLAAQELVFALCLSWWTSYTMRYYPMLEGEAARARYKVVENRVLVLSTPLQVLAAVVNLAFIGAPLTGDLVGATILFSLTRSLTSHLGERGRSSGDILAYSVGQLASAVLGFALAYVAIAAFAATPAAALFGYAAAQALALVWLVRRMSGTTLFGRADLDMVRAALRYGLPLVVSGCIGWVGLNGIRIVVERWQGIEAVGLVAVGWGLGQRIASVAAMLLTAAAYPLAVKALKTSGRAGALEQLSINAAMLFALIAPMCVGILLVAEPLVHLAIAAPFRAVTLEILPVAVMIGAIRNFRMHLGDQVLLLLERPAATIVIYGIEAVATIVCCSVGLASWGLLGAGLGCLVATVIAAAVSLWMAAAAGLQLPLGHMARITLAALVMACVLRLVPHPTGFAGLVAQVATGAAIYFGALAALYPAILVKGCRRVTATLRLRGATTGAA